MKVGRYVGMNTRKRSRKQERKQELDQESDQENKKTRPRPRKRPRKKGKNFLGRVLVFFLFPVFFFSFFLTFLFSFINSLLRSFFVQPEWDRLFQGRWQLWPRQGQGSEFCAAVPWLGARLAFSFKQRIHKSRENTSGLPTRYNSWLWSANPTQNWRQIISCEGETKAYYL